MRKIVLTFGLIAGAVLSVMMVITQVFMDSVGFDNGEVIGYSTMVLAFLMIFFGVKSYRDNVAGGTVKFGKAFGVGLLIMLVGSLCYVATWEVIYYKVAPDFGDKYAAHMVKKAKEAGASQAKIDSTVKQMAEFNEMYKNPFFNVGMTLLEPSPVGFLVSLISAGVLSRKKREDPAA